LLDPPTVKERIDSARQHLADSLAWKGPKLGVLEMRRHYAPYLRDLPHIKPYRAKLVTLMQPNELFEVLDEIEAIYTGVLQFEQVNETISA
jgi:tRNA-dihydrouridine synthase